MAQTKVFVGNLSFKTKDDNLAEYFKTAGSVTKANIITRGPRSLGYGFVEFSSEAEAENAVNLLNKKVLDEREINVQLAKPRDEATSARPPRPPRPPRGSSDAPRRRSRKYSGGPRTSSVEQQQQLQPQQQQQQQQRSPKLQQQRNTRQMKSGNSNTNTITNTNTNDNNNNSELENWENQGPGEVGEGRGRGRGRRGRARGRRGRFIRGWERGGRASPSNNYNYNNNTGSNNNNNNNTDSGQQEVDQDRRRRRFSYRRANNNNRPLSKDTLFVANLPFSVDDEKLHNLFKEHSDKVVKAHVVVKANGKSKGFGFVVLDGEEEQQKALAGLDKYILEGRELSVKVAFQIEERGQSTHEDNGSNLNSTSNTTDTSPLNPTEK